MGEAGDKIAVRSLQALEAADVVQNDQGADPHTRPVAQRGAVHLQVEAPPGAGDDLLGEGLRGRERPGDEADERGPAGASLSELPIVVAGAWRRSAEPAALIRSTRPAVSTASTPSTIPARMAS